MMVFLYLYDGLPLSIIMMVFLHPIDPMMVFPYPMDPMMVFPLPYGSYDGLPLPYEGSHTLWIL